MTFLYALHDGVISAIFVIVLTGMALAVMHLVRRLMPAETLTKETMDLGLRVLPALVSMAAFLLAFAVVQSKNDITRIQQAVVSEGATLLDLDRTLRRYDPAITAPLRDQLVAYARSVVEEEWPAMARDDTSPPTAERLGALLAGLRTLHPDTPRMTTLYAAIEADMDKLAELRDGRLHDARIGVPGLFWAMILCLHGAIMVLGGMFRPTPWTTMLIGALNAGLALLTAFLFVHDRPFLGDTSVSPEPLLRFLAAATQ